MKAIQGRAYRALVVFGHVLGPKIGAIKGVAYEQFILPGLVVFYSMIGMADMSVALSFVVLIVMAVLSCGVCMVLFNRGLD